MKPISRETALPFRFGTDVSGKAVIGFAVVLCCAMGVVKLHADTFVIPQGLENLEGEGGSLYPFNTQNPFARMQFLVDDSLFGALAPGIRITEIAFRASGQPPGRSFDVTFDAVEVRMSTTSQSPESISPTFSDNIGSDETLVRARTPVTWSTTVVPGQVNPFSLRLPLTTPYDYVPSRGNLLLDIQVFGGAATYNIDAQRLLDTEQGLAWGDGQFATGNGLVTQFTFDAIPEPTSGALLALGVVGLVIGVWKRGKT